MAARLSVLGDQLGLHCHAIRYAGQLRALAPWVELDGWLRELPTLFEPGDLIWADHESLEALISDLASQTMPVFLWRVPATSPTIEMMRRHFSGKGVVLVRPAMATPYVDLTRHGENVLANARRRADIRRAERKAAQFGTVSYEIHAPTSETELLPLMEKVYSIETRSWKEREGSSLTTSTWQGDFFMRFSQEAARAGMLRIAILRIGGAAVAMQVAAEWKRRFWLFKISHDEQFNMCSPGHLLMWHTLSEADRLGLLSYEFLGGMDSWRTLWTNLSRSYVELRAYPYSLASGKVLLRGVARKVRARVQRAMG